MDVSMDENRWEHGSSFHWPGVSEMAGAAESDGGWPGVGAGAEMFATGRGALRVLFGELLELGEDATVWVPSYFCQKVTGSMAQTGIQLRAYRDEPGTRFEIPGALESGDVLFVVNGFGLREQPQVLDDMDTDDVVIVEDHSHDPGSDWAAQSRADWCVASYRKTLPMPDGAALWSPVGHAVSGSEQRGSPPEDVAHRMLASMQLKRAYLAGKSVDKETFRSLHHEAETAFTEEPEGEMSRLSRELFGSMPVERWRQRRRRNWKAVRREVESAIPGRVLEPESERCVPFAIVCVFEEAGERDRVGEALIQERIYPAEIWPLEKPAVALPETSRELSDRMFCVQCDWRYDRADMERVVETVRSVV